MAADARRVSAPQAPQACLICKNRKKKCTKSLPSCGYCKRKQLNCTYALLSHPPRDTTLDVDRRSYEPFDDGRLPADPVSSRIILSAPSHGDETRAEILERQVYLEVHEIIRATGQFLDDISTRYFQGYHRHFPIISRTRFSNSLITSGTIPTADVSVLLLVMCLVTHVPALQRQSDNATQSYYQLDLYLTVKSLFSQVQVSYRPSIHLVQAGLLLALYEYKHGRPDDAFTTTAGITRIAYAVRIHSRDCYQKYLAQTADHDANGELLLQAEEAANTWWGITICERTFLSEVAILDQPLITAFPTAHSPLPVEPQVLDHLDVSDAAFLPSIPMSCLTSPMIGGFGRTAQATCLLEQVLKAFHTANIDSRLLQLEGLDTSIQSFLALVMPQCLDLSGDFCAALNIAIRALFVLHCHIVAQEPQPVSAKFRTLDEWHSRSRQALNTVTKMVVDIAVTLMAASAPSTARCMIDAMPATYPYIVLAALKHIRHHMDQEDCDWMVCAQDLLQQSLEKYLHRRGVSEDQFAIERW